MEFIKGEPPGPRAGEISELTRDLRPPLALSDEECRIARKLRRARLEISAIADRLNTSELCVQQALATMRTRRKLPSRRTLNVTVAAHEFVKGEADSHEAYWETVDRLFGELALRRAWAGVPISSRGELPE